MIASITDHFTGEKWNEVEDDKMVVALIERVKTEGIQKYRLVQT